MELFAKQETNLTDNFNNNAEFMPLYYQPILHRPISTSLISSDGFFRIDLTGDLADIGRGAIDGSADVALFAPVVAVTLPRPVDGRCLIGVMVVTLVLRPLWIALKSDELRDDDMDAGWSR